MKKIAALCLTLALVFSLTIVSAAASGNDRHSSSKGQKSTTSTAEKVNPAKTSNSPGQDKTSKTDASSSSNDKNAVNKKKQFKLELNAKKKELQQQKSALSQQKEDLEAQYKTLITAGDTAGAAVIKEKMDALNTQIGELQSQVKKVINERYMVVKTMYSDAELAQFNSAAEMISKMYQNADTLNAGSVTVNNNLIKFDAPPYIKGGTTLVPVRAISESLGADVSWDQNTKTVMITKDNTVVKLTMNSTAVLVNGTSVQISLPAESACGRTYVPLRFLAEALNFEVNWDDENALIDIHDSTSTGTTTTDTAAAGTAAAGTATTGTTTTGTTTTGTTTTGTTTTGTAAAGTTTTGTAAAGTTTTGATTTVTPDASSNDTVKESSAN